MPRWPLALCPALFLALAACGDEGASAPGGVSAGEAKALEDAAAMLDERRLPPEALVTAIPTEVAREAEFTPAEKQGRAAPPTNR